MHGYTQSEINSHISKAEHEMRCQESNMRHREFMVKSKARWVNHMSRKNISSMSQSENGRGEAEYNKWKYTKPDIKVFVNDADWHIKEAQSALTPFTFIAVFPGLIVSMVEVESSAITSMIPFLNFSLLFNEIAASNVNALHILLMFVSTVLIIVIVFKIIVKQYKTENILFSN